MGVTRLENLPVMGTAVFEIAEVTFKPNAGAVEFRGKDVLAGTSIRNLVRNHFPDSPDDPVKFLVYVLGTSKTDPNRFAYRIGVPIDMSNIEGYFVTKKDEVEDYRALTPGFW